MVTDFPSCDCACVMQAGQNGLEKASSLHGGGGGQVPTKQKVNIVIFPSINLSHRKPKLHIFCRVKSTVLFVLSSQQNCIIIVAFSI